MFLGVPLFLVVLVFNALFNRKPTTGLKNWKRARFLSCAGFVLAGSAATFVSGIIWEVWLIFAVIGAILGFIAGMV